MPPEIVMRSRQCAAAVSESASKFTPLAGSPGCRSAVADQTSRNASRAVAAPLGAPTAIAAPAMGASIEFWSGRVAGSREPALVPSSS